MSERAQRITEERELCQVHGLAFAVYDVTLGGWRCLGQGDHWKTAESTLTAAMLEDMRRLGIDPEQEEGA